MKLRARTLRVVSEIAACSSLRFAYIANGTTSKGGWPSNKGFSIAKVNINAVGRGYGK